MLGTAFRPARDLNDGFWISAFVKEKSYGNLASIQSPSQVVCAGTRPETTNYVAIP